MAEPIVNLQGIEIKGNPFGTSTFVRLLRSQFQNNKFENKPITNKEINRKETPINIQQL